MKKTFSLLFLVFFLFSSFSSQNVHEFYLSVTEINYDDEEKSLQIISRVFIDDLEEVLSTRYGKKVSLGYEEDLESNAGLISRYIDKKLNISVNGKEQKLKYLGSKFDADQLVMFIEVNDVSEPEKVWVENLVLTDLFDSQKNIVHVKKGGKIESMLLMKDNGQKTVKF